MESRWSPTDAPEDAAGDVLDLRVHVSRLLGAEPSLVVWGGGNTSVKLREEDFRGETVDVLRVKGSGSDLKTIERHHFSGVRQQDIERLRGVRSMSDEAMVDYLMHALLDPADPRPSIETLLHGFVPRRWVDHTHADAIVALTNQRDPEDVLRRVFGDRVAVLPWVRPGFDLSRAVLEALEARPAVDGIVLVNHGLITFGDEARESYERTIELVTAAERYIEDARGGARRFAGIEIAPPGPRRAAVVGAAIRGAIPFPTVIEHDDSPATLAFTSSPRLLAATRRGPATPDHALRAKGWPATVAVPDPEDGDSEDEVLTEAVRASVASYVAEYEAYVARYASEQTPRLDPYPRLILVAGAGLFAAGRTAREACIALDIYRRTIEVVADAEEIGEYRPIAEAALFEMEYWPLELYKLTLAPPPKPLSGRIALVTGAASGIGRAIAYRLSLEGAVVAVTDIDANGAERVAAEILERAGQPRAALALTMDVSNEGSVAAAFEAVAAEYGGLDIVVSNAGTAVVSPIERLALSDWERSMAVNATGHFLVAREGVRLLRRQSSTASIVFVSSKNAFAPGAEFGAYSAAKAAETQLAKVLAIEHGGDGIRVNIVNPDAVFAGSNLWSPEVRESRASAHGVEAGALEDFYAQRNLLGERILPEDVADAVFFLASDESSKITGCTITVDGGVAAAFPR